MNNPYLALLEQEAERQRTAQSASLLAAPLPSPEAYAELNRAARVLGIQPAAVETTPEQSKLEAQAALIQRDTARSAALQRRYTDDHFKKLASDDSSVLGKLGDAVAATTRYVMGADSRGAQQAGAPQALAAGVYDMNRGYAGLFTALLEVLNTPGELAETALAQARGKKDYLASGPLAPGIDLFRREATASKVRADELVPASDSIVKSGVNSGLRSLVGSVSTLPLALLPGGQAMALRALPAMQGGGAFEVKS
jgi:Large polyvalent protein associated domain 22